MRLSLAPVVCHACQSSLTDTNNSYLECRGLIGSLSIFNALILWSLKSGLTFEGRALRPSRKKKTIKTDNVKARDQPIFDRTHKY